MDGKHQRRGPERDRRTGDPPTRRRILAVGAAVAGAGLAGCVTVDPRARLSDRSGKDVFAGVSVSDAWGSGSVQATVGLTEAATSTHGVRRLAVVGPGGSDHWSGAVEGGQTSVRVSLPTGGAATLSASDARGRSVGSATVTVDGRSFP